MKTAREELAWAAGFFDGEGTTCIHNIKHSHGTYPALTVSVSQKGRLLLERFQRAVGGVGAIYERHSRDGMCAWSTGKFSSAQAVLARLWTFLGEPKRQQAARSLKVMSAYRARPEYRRRAKAEYCKLGHKLTLIYKNMRGCKVCREASIKRWHAENPDRVKAAQLRYREKLKTAKANSPAKPERVPK